MLVYNVIISIEVQCAEEWKNWMTEKHIPDILKTGLFTQYNFFEMRNTNQTIREFIIFYYCKDVKTYNLYQQKYAPMLQNEHTEKYKNKFKVNRNLYFLAN